MGPTIRITLRRSSSINSLEIDGFYFTICWMKYLKINNPAASSGVLRSEASPPGATQAALALLASRRVAPPALRQEAGNTFPVNPVGLKSIYTARSCRSGFSLVELSVVLVIIGLVVGAIVAGKNLVAASELRSVIADVDRFVTGINGFRDKYHAFPGDMANATAFWGAQHATPATCITTASTTIATCNGDGNGTITTPGSTGTYYEAFRAWQHLSNAGFVDGKFNGIPSAATTLGSQIGTNVPKSRINGAGFTLYYVGTTSGDANFYDETYRHAILFGSAASNVPTYSPVISPANASSIDVKLDDGKPSTGKVLAFKSTSAITPLCTTTAVVSTAAYTLTTPTEICSLVLKTGF